MPYLYMELTRRQLAAKYPSQPPASEMTPMQRSSLKVNTNSALGTITQALNELGADSWELVSVLECRDLNGELLYTFKKLV